MTSRGVSLSGVAVKGGSTEARIAVRDQPENNLRPQGIYGMSSLGQVKGSFSRIGRINYEVYRQFGLIHRQSEWLVAQVLLGGTARDLCERIRQLKVVSAKSLRSGWATHMKNDNQTQEDTLACAGWSVELKGDGEATGRSLSPGTVSGSRWSSA